MFKLDNAFLEELGLGSLPPVEKNKMLAHIYETLEMRVGMKLAEQMTNEQLDEFESYINKKDEAGALKWLESNFPNYKQVVAEELEKLKGEIKQVAPQIVAQSAAAQQANLNTQQSAQPAPNQQQQPAPQQPTQAPPQHQQPGVPPQYQQQPPSQPIQQPMPQPTPVQQPNPQNPQPMPPSQHTPQDQNSQPPQPPQQPWQPQ